MEPLKKGGSHHVCLAWCTPQQWHDCIASTNATWELVQSGVQAPTEEIVAQGIEASKVFIRQLAQAQV